MDTVKVNKGAIKMIAHRGVSGLERENTIAAFVAAGQRSYYGIETDVHLTADGKFIVVHDDNLQRVAGIDMSIEGSTFAELRKVRLTDLDGTPREDLCLPSLEEYIHVCRKYEKQAVLELKNRMPKEKVWEIAEIIKGMGWFDRTTFISFAGQNLADLKERYPQAEAQLLAKTCTQEYIDFMIEHNLDADLYGYNLTEDLVQALRAAGKKINVWTIDKPEYMNIAQAFNLDFVTSNILE